MFNLIIGFFLLLVSLRLWTHRDKIFTGDKKGVFYVYNPLGHGPQYIHGSYESALKEAQRLACKHPECRFEILKIMQFVEASSKDELIGEDEIPF